MASPMTLGKAISSTSPYQESPEVTVVVVGQVPPPVNGQTLMISEFLGGEYPGLRLVHVPMKFSRSTSEIGSFGFRKLVLLFSTLAAIFRAAFRARSAGGPSILYYPPAGANLVPVLRDLVLLIPTRWLFTRTVFHFHAAGLYGIYPRLPAILRPLFHLAYDKPDLAIFTTNATSAEADLLHARSKAIIPCGIADAAPQRTTDGDGADVADKSPPKILFAGILCEGKGIVTLLEACRILHGTGIDFRLVCLGAFQSADFQQEVGTLIREAGLEGRVAFPGVLGGAQKWDAFASASIFCFPSHYPAESFGVVLIEAMSFSLPIVATEWQGIPEVAGNSGGSILVPIKQAAALATCLQTLLLSPERRLTMGKLNRQRYLDLFTVRSYRENLHKSLLAVAGPVSRPLKNA